MLNFKNIFTGLFISIYLLLSCHLSLYGNSINFRNSNDEIHVETTEMGTDNLTVLMSKRDIYGVTITFSDHIDYPDAVILMNNTNVPCKIIKMFDSKILVDFPKSWVKSLRIDFSDEEYSPRQKNYSKRANERYSEVDEEEVRERFDDHRQQRRTKSFVDNEHIEREEYRNRITRERYIDNVEEVRESNRNNYGKASYYDEDYDDDDVLDIVMLEDELEERYLETDKSMRTARSDVKDWLLSEINNAKSEGKSNRQSYRQGSRQVSRQGSRQAEKFDLLDKTLRDDNTIEKNNQASRSNERVQFSSNSGRIKGKFLYSGNPLESCKVRLVKLRKVGLIYYKDTETEEATSIEVSTDRRGTFTINNAKPGFYKLYWKPPTESSWIRRVSMEPDVIVTAGEIANLDDIETNQRILN
ncbi:MAG: hypothetical protein ACUZ8O_09090 [Candidatus Anammoxibacter sp.]